MAYGASWHVQLGYSDWTAATDPMAGQWGHSAGPNARMAWLYVRVRSDSRWTDQMGDCMDSGGMAGPAEAVSAKRLACDSVGVLCITFLSTS